MEIRQTAQLLAKAALVDNRQVSPEIVATWHEAVGHLDYQTALAALDRHRANSTEYLVPAHINENARIVRQHQAHDEAKTRAMYALPAPRSGGVPDWFWERAGIQRTTQQAPPWPCPWCGARELEPCTNRGKRNGPVHNGIHPERQAAPLGVASTPRGARSMASPPRTPVYGGCGTEGCTECHPLFDADNNEIPCPEDCACTGQS